MLLDNLDNGLNNLNGPTYMDASNNVIAPVYAALIANVGITGQNIDLVEDPDIADGASGGNPDAGYRLRVNGAVVPSHEFNSLGDSYKGVDQAGNYHPSITLPYADEL